MRNELGQFVAGNAGGPGRPPRSTEQAYMEATINNCSLEDWGAIVRRAVQDAIAGDAQARTFLANYLIGKPKETVQVNRAVIESDHEYDHLTDDELRALIALSESEAAGHGGSTQQASDISRYT
jgi:hypothetical protein